MEPSRKKTKGTSWLQDVDQQAQMKSTSHNVIDCENNDIKSHIERKLHSVKTLVEQELDLDHILSKVSYRSILENMFQSCSTASENMMLQVITKSFEEGFMRQPHQNETACVMGSMCECQFIDSCAPFTAVEFRMPEDPPAEAQMCVLCSRRTTQKMFYDMCYAGKAPKCVIQRYGNIFGQPGEYSVECMLACPQGFDLHCMPLPIMSHQRNKYSVLSSGGLKYLKQHRVSYEHFQTPSATTQD
jgi:hypothetical protein